MTRPAEPGDQVLRLLDAAIAETGRSGRDDLAAGLTAERAEFTSGAWHVLIAGEFKKGKSSLVNALIGVEVCSADPVAFTAAPTIVRYGETATATLVLDGPDDLSRRRCPIAVEDAARYAVSGVDDSGDRLYAVEVSLRRELLRTGLVLIDTPGLGGGFAAGHAAATMRAMSLADAVVVVSDASQEYAAAEVEFLRHAARVSSYLLCLLTKTDLYPEWQRILEIDRGHLRRAGLDIDILPVSSTLRGAALTTGDRELNNESGFPVVVARLRGQLSEQRSTIWGARAVEAARAALSQVSGTLTAEHTALTRPEERPAALDRIGAARRRAERLSGAGARWLNTMQDRFADIQSKVDTDLQALVRRVEADAGHRIRAGDPVADWAEFVPWLHQHANEELTAVHTNLLALIDEVGAEVAKLFDGEAADVGRLIGSVPPPSAGERRLEPLSIRRPSKIEIGMHAARGWSLSSSVITTLLVTTLHPGLLLVLPITAALGTVFAVKTVRGFRAARLDGGRSEAVRAVAGYLNQARADAARSAADVLRHSRSRIRDYYLDRAAELTKTAAQEHTATVRAAEVDTGDARQRAERAATDLARVRGLLEAAARLQGGAG
jgi:hypothetical protein